MADPRPSTDDPLIIFGSVSMPARQGPSTVNPPTSGGIPSFGDPQLGCNCLCCPPMPPGCPIGPLPCECGFLTCDFVPFPPQFSSCCCPSDKPVILLNSGTATQTICNNSETTVSVGTIEFNRGFVVCGSTAIIPKAGVYHMQGNVCTQTPLCAATDWAELILYQCSTPFMYSTICGVKVKCHPIFTSAYRLLDPGNVMSLRFIQSTGAAVTIGSACPSGQSKFSLQFIKGC